MSEDTLMGYIRSRLDAMDHKLDGIAHLAERISPLESSQSLHNGRLTALEEGQEAIALAYAKQDGRNTVIAWLLGLIGAPLVVGLALIGMDRLL